MLTSSKQLELSYHGNQSFPTFLFSTELQVKLICRGTGPTYSSCTLFTFGKTVLTNLSAVVLRCRMFRRISTESLRGFFLFFFFLTKIAHRLLKKKWGEAHTHASRSVTRTNTELGFVLTRGPVHLLCQENICIL